MDKKEIALKIYHSIDWENWKDEEGNYFTVNQVLQNKINGFLETSENPELDNLLGTFETVLNLIDIEKLINL